GSRPPVATELGFPRVRSLLGGRSRIYPTSAERGGVRGIRQSTASRGQPPFTRRTCRQACLHAPRPLPTRGGEVEPRPIRSPNRVSSPVETARGDCLSAPVRPQYREAMYDLATASSHTVVDDATARRV